MSDEVPITGVFAGRYRVGAELGRGGSAVVYSATDEETGRQVALKVLRADFAQAVDATRFLREVELSGALAHPRIVPIIGNGQADGRPFFVLPLLSGGTLRDRLVRERQLPVEEAVAITRSIADALTHAHAHKVIHRDVKPENVLFAAGVAHLADFGIARALEQVLGETTTTTGVVRGTPAYMSPEQAAGERSLDARTDIYSLGCVVYEMLAGMPAFSGPTQQSVMAQRITHGPRPLSVYRPSVSAAMQDVVNRALAPAAADRWQTVAEFADALERALASRDAAPPLGIDERVPRGPQRARAWRAAALVAIVASAGVALWWGITGPRDQAAGAVAGSGTVIAIVPFAAATPLDSTLRDGLVDVLARGFDGAGPLRAVPPSVVYSAWRARVADTITAADLGRRVGASVVVFGMIGRRGPDTLQVSATLFDVAAGRVLGEINVSDAESHFLRLTDSVTTGVLRRLAADRPIAAIRGGSFAATSMPALKAFLRGEQLLRRNEYQRAESAYEESVRIDSSFALGWHRMRTVRRALTGEFDTLAASYGARAGRLNRRMTVRDSLLVRADSFAAITRPRSGLLALTALRANALARERLLEHAASRYPEDPEIWEELGEARHHFGDLTGATASSAHDAFRRAIRLDPSYLPPYFHAVELGAGFLSLDDLAELMRAYALLDPHRPGVALGSRMVQTMQRRAHSADLVPRDAPAADLRAAATLLRRGRFEPDIIEPLFRRALAAEQKAGDTGAATAEWLAYVLLRRGRAHGVDSVRPAVSFEARPAERLLQLQLGGSPQTVVDSVLGAWLAGNSIEHVVTAIPDGLVRLDETAARRVRVWLDSMSRSADSAAAQTARFGLSVADAYTRLGRARSVRDSVSAATRLAGLPDSLCWWRCWTPRRAHAELLLALSRPADAAALLDRHPPSASRELPSEIEWHALRARAAAALGDRNLAEIHAGIVRSVWGNGDAGAKRLISVLNNAIGPR